MAQQNNLNKAIEEKKYLSVSLTPEWFERLLLLVDKDRQSSGAAQVRFMIRNREDELGINQEKKNE